MFGDLAYQTRAETRPRRYNLVPDTSLKGSSWTSDALLDVTGIDTPGMGPLRNHDLGDAYEPMLVTGISPNAPSAPTISPSLTCASIKYVPPATATAETFTVAVWMSPFIPGTTYSSGLPITVTLSAGDGVGATYGSKVWSYVLDVDGWLFSPDPLSITFPAGTETIYLDLQLTFDSAIVDEKSTVGVFCPMLFTGSSGSTPTSQDEIYPVVTTGTARDDAEITNGVNRALVCRKCRDERTHQLTNPPTPTPDYNARSHIGTYGGE